jgi:hypothetical protein
MLHKCVNQNCSATFRNLSRGRLFAVEMDDFGSTLPELMESQPKLSHRLEYYWLCDQCAYVLTLSYEKGRGIVAVPLPEASGRRPAISIRMAPALRKENNRRQPSAL